MNLTVGQRTLRSLHVSEDMVRAYAQLSGDYNPLHIDKEFISQTNFKGLIAQGGIATSLIHALVAMDMAGPGSVFLNQNWKFPNPVHINDTITAEAVVTSVSKQRSIAKMAITVTDESGKKVLSGDVTVMQTFKNH